ncbi:MAG: hypothetical protein M3Y35_01205 [Actinomycetota bacterium]|nr:hypothetical protein [Actinomycetota bacterium]
MSAGPGVDHTAKLSQVIDDIDDAIRQIRTSIFALHSALGGNDTIRGLLLQTVNEVAGSLRQMPTVRFAGPLDTVISTDLLQDIQAVLR